MRQRRPAATIIGELIALTKKMYKGDFSRHSLPTTYLSAALTSLTVTRSSSQNFSDDHQSYSLQKKELKLRMRLCRDAHTGTHIRRRQSRKKLLALLNELDVHLEENDGRGSDQIVAYAKQLQDKSAQSVRRADAYNQLTKTLSVSESGYLFRAFKASDAPNPEVLDRLLLQENRHIFMELNDRRFALAISFRTDRLKDLLDGKTTIQAIAARQYGINHAAEFFKSGDINETNITEMAFSKLTENLSDHNRRMFEVGFKRGILFSDEAKTVFERLLDYPEIYSDLDDRRVSRKLTTPAKLNAHIDAVAAERLASSVLTATEANADSIRSSTSAASEGSLVRRHSPVMFWQPAPKIPSPPSLGDSGLGVGGFFAEHEAEHYDAALPMIAVRA
ncbi:MAG: hypothetical protein P1U63_09385 [Coxiellaceae bacterium]|nr:hypothetical protein [Coxiellaceae bacterium]